MTGDRGKTSRKKTPQCQTCALMQPSCPPHLPCPYQVRATASQHRVPTYINHSHYVLILLAGRSRWAEDVRRSQDPKYAPVQGDVGASDVQGKLSGVCMPLNITLQHTDTLVAHTSFHLILIFTFGKTTTVPTGDISRRYELADSLWKGENSSGASRSLWDMKHRGLMPERVEITGRC